MLQKNFIILAINLNNKIIFRANKNFNPLKSFFPYKFINTLE